MNTGLSEECAEEAGGHVVFVGNRALYVKCKQSFVDSSYTLVHCDTQRVSYTYKKNWFEKLFCLKGIISVTNRVDLESIRGCSFAGIILQNKYIADKETLRFLMSRLRDTNNKKYLIASLYENKKLTISTELKKMPYVEDIINILEEDVSRAEWKGEIKWE